MAFTNLADVVAHFDPEDITIKRFGAPTRANGNATKPSSSDVLIEAVIWPSTGQDIRRLPEGLRTDEARTVLTTTSIKPSIDPSAGYPDRFDYEGFTWEIQVVTDWSAKGGYYLGVAVKVSE